MIASPRADLTFRTTKQEQWNERAQDSQARKKERGYVEQETGLEEAFSAGWGEPERVRRQPESLGEEPERLREGGAILDDIKVAQLVRARDFRSQGRRFDSSKTPKPKNSNLHGFELQRPSSKGSNYCFKKET